MSRYAEHGRSNVFDESYWKLVVLCRLSKEDINHKTQGIYPHITISHYIESKLTKTISWLQYKQVDDLVKRFIEEIETVTLTLVPSESSKYQLVKVCPEIKKLREQIARYLNTTHKSSIDDESIEDCHITAKLSLADHVLKSKELVLDTKKFIVSVTLSPLKSNVKLFNHIYERDGIKNKIANKIAKAHVAITENNYHELINGKENQEIVAYAFKDINNLTIIENMNENERKHNQDNEIHSSNKKQKL